MSLIFDNMNILKDRLLDIPAVKTSKIGIEANIAPEDYPIVRIVPSIIRKTDSITRSTELLIYFGTPVHESEDGLEAIYESLLNLEQAIIQALNGNGFLVKYLDTIIDEDRVEHFKLFAIRAEMQSKDSCSNSDN